jgi:hypothetical protein
MHHTHHFVPLAHYCCRMSSRNRKAWVGTDCVSHVLALAWCGAQQRESTKLDAHSPFHSSCPLYLLLVIPVHGGVVLVDACLQASANIMLIFATHLFSTCSRDTNFLFHCKRMLCQSNEVTISFSYTTHIYFRHRIDTRTTGAVNSRLFSTILRCDWVFALSVASWPPSISQCHQCSDCHHHSIVHLRCHCDSQSTDILPNLFSFVVVSTSFSHCSNVFVPTAIQGKSVWFVVVTIFSKIFMYYIWPWIYFMRPGRWVGVRCTPARSLHDRNSIFSNLNIYVYFSSPWI